MKPTKNLCDWCKQIPVADDERKLYGKVCEECRPVCLDACANRKDPQCRKFVKLNWTKRQSLCESCRRNTRSPKLKNRSDDEIKAALDSKLLDNSVQPWTLRRLKRKFRGEFDKICGEDAIAVRNWLRDNRLALTEHDRRDLNESNVPQELRLGRLTESHRCQKCSAGITKPGHCSACSPDSSELPIESIDEIEKLEKESSDDFDIQSLEDAWNDREYWGELEEIASEFDDAEGRSEVDSRDPAFCLESIEDPYAWRPGCEADQLEEVRFARECPPLNPPFLSDEQFGEAERIKEQLQIKSEELAKLQVNREARSAIPTYEGRPAQSDRTAGLNWENGTGKGRIPAELDFSDRPRASGADGENASRDRAIEWLTRETRATVDRWIISRTLKTCWRHNSFTKTVTGPKCNPRWELQPSGSGDRRLRAAVFEYLLRPRKWLDLQWYRTADSEISKSDDWTGLPVLIHRDSGDRTEYMFPFTWNAYQVTIRAFRRHAWTRRRCELTESLGNTSGDQNWDWRNPGPRLVVRRDDLRAFLSERESILAMQAPAPTQEPILSACERRRTRLSVDAWCNEMAAQVEKTRKLKAEGRQTLGEHIARLLTAQRDESGRWFDKASRLKAERQALLMEVAKVGKNQAVVRDQENMVKESATVNVPKKIRSYAFTDKRKLRTRYLEAILDAAEEGEPLPHLPSIETVGVEIGTGPRHARNVLLPLKRIADGKANVRYSCTRRGHANRFCTDDGENQNNA
jgi:hypothetical protein